MVEAYAQALYTLAAQGMDPKEAAKRMRALLARDGREKLFPRIGSALVRIAKERAGRTAELTVAKIDDTTEARKISGAPAEVTVRIDPTIIGGWRLRIGSTLTNVSYKKHLQDIYHHSLTH